MKLHYDNIVIGSELNALMYAFINQFPVFYTEAQQPFRFDYFDPEVKLDFLGIPHQKKKYNAIDTNFVSGIAKILLWERLLFLMSLKGLVPLSNLCHRIRCTGDTIKFSNDYSKILEVDFDNCHYFSDESSAGFTKRAKLDELEYMCYDYIAFNKGGKHEIDLIHTGDDFVSEIWFYSSDRIDGNSPVRDACAVSKLTSQQLTDFDFSETMARFKTLKIMKDHGMRGPQNGYTSKGTPRHYDFKTSSIRREIRGIENRPEPSSARIQIQNVCEKSLLRSLESSVGPYNTILGYLNEQQNSS